ncbi:MAG: serine/threonine-protein kinase [Magnetococcus sp. DMHC-6]
MNTGFWRHNWFVALLLTLLFILTDYSTLLIQGLERTAYDWGVQASSRPLLNNPIAIIAIDEQSIANLGRWPWSRQIHAKMIHYLTLGKPKVIAHTVLFPESQIDPGLSPLLNSLEYLKKSRLKKIFASPADKNNKFDPLLAQEIRDLESLLSAGVQSLNSDQQLANALHNAQNVLLALSLNPGDPRGNPEHDLPEYVQRFSIPAPVMSLQEKEMPTITQSALPPIASLGQEAAGMGILNHDIDIDGGVRSLPLVMSYYGAFYPSIALITSAMTLNLKPKDIHFEEQGIIRLGNLKIRTNDHFRMRPLFYQNETEGPTFTTDSFFDVFTGKIPATKYQDKIVLIGPTAMGIGNFRPTPISPAMATVEILAHAITSILNTNAFVIPSWGYYAKGGVYFTIFFYIWAFLPRLNASAGAIWTLAVALFLLFIHLYLMLNQSLWLQFMGPLVLLITGYFVVTTKRFLITEKGKLRSDAESAESNRMLGLAFQGQGQLDLAFEKFRKCPVDTPMLEILYNLGLDFERRRQFGKAAWVYQYIHDHHPQYRDVSQRIKRSTSLDNTVVLNGGTHTMGITELLDESGEVQKPMLGRYVIEKELGKGAMGTVYEGSDPKIHRTVAIKTLSLQNEFEGQELEEAKKRFFREAESAGRLNHPNIVTIFDTGEEQNLAYIAMELLKGHDLERYTKPNHLLPLPQLINIIAKVALALDYAHQNDVVHRDIKPANIMYEPSSNTIKVTDFGIARLTEGGRTKTKTGFIMGTPYYMSPEQISGKTVDGRSDFFSLGAMFFQLLTGTLPFQAKDMANLLFQITQEPHRKLTDLRPDLPPCLEDIMNKILEKDPENRYQKGGYIAKALVTCFKTLPRKP